MPETPSPGAGQGGEVRRPSALETSFLAQHRYPPEPHAPGAEPPRRGVGLRVVLPLCLLAVLIGGIAWVAQYLPNWRQGRQSVAPPPTLSLLRLTGVGTAEEDPKTGYVREFERGAEGHIDFLLENTSPGDVELGVQWKQCTCSRLEVCVLAPAEAYPLLELDKQAGDDTLPEARRRDKVVEGRVALERLTGRLKGWQPINEGDTRGVNVPAGRGVVVRLIWRAREDERFKLKAGVWMVPAGQVIASESRPVMSIEPTVELVPAVRVHPEKQAVGRLYARNSVTKEFLFWTSTRDNLQVQLTGDPDPCLVCEVTPISPAELPEVQKKLLAARINTRIRAACRLTATLYEQREGRQLDMGALLRTIPVKVTADGQTVDVASPLLYGRVHSDIRVAGADEREQINLGSFKSRDGTAQTIGLLARPDATLKLEGPQPAFLELKLTKKETVEGETTWELDVSVPPNAFAGALPGDTAVVLLTSSLGTSPRRVRIHVTGTAARD